ncbi:MAG: ATP-binding protein [Pseudomonadota bacterium]
MQRLHRRLYLAIVATLLVFLAFVAILLHGTSLVMFRHGSVISSVHVLLLLLIVAALLAFLTYPMTRGITARLARLEQSVRRFGGGDLTARVAVEGHDEVAALATSFNESATRVQQLVHANRQLLANCSHELRTPLARMQLAIERRGADVAAADAELRRDITELDALIAELLLSSRLDAARTLPRVEPVELLALAAEEAAYFDLEASGDAITVRGDPLLLRRLCRNLLENARLHAGGATAISVHGDGNIARVLVEDAGPGIAYPDRERIFEPFYRPDAVSGSGTGLGLSIVRQIARLHGGDVLHEPRAGGGSRFVATLRSRPA